jgi:Ras GTPase-activating-like protein IQGAP2/3
VSSKTFRFPAFRSSFITVADVSDAETQYHAHEFLDATVQAKPIDITPNEVYSMHTILSQHLDHLVRIYFVHHYNANYTNPAQAPSRDDPLRAILNELNGVPTVGDNELTDARDHPITLELTNRFAHVRGKERLLQI